MVYVHFVLGVVPEPRICFELLVVVVWCIHESAREGD